MKKKSFFERLTGGVSTSDYDYEEEEEIAEEVATVAPSKKLIPKGGSASNSNIGWIEDDGNIGQLTVDVYQTPNEIIIKTLVAGVKRDDLDISLSRDMVTIKGKRDLDKTVEEDDYFHRELYWGSFSRTVLLPHEVDVEGAEATENNGLLTIRLPKIDKDRQTKLRVKAS